jgi:DNA-binding transcriptional MerR regulator
MAFAFGAQKAPEAFRTISEVAAELDVPQHVLRFWETKFATLRPLKRGGGRRYYRPDDVDLLRGIRALLHRDALTIRGVQKILKEQGARYVIELGRRTVHLLAPRGEASPAQSDGLTNVRVFRHGVGKDVGEDRVLRAVQREHFCTLLDELTELKARLAAARRRPLRGQ